MTRKLSFFSVSLLFLFFGFLTLSECQAQATLDFNNVVNLRGHCASGAHAIGTVPAGKTWKIENIITNDTDIELVIPGASNMDITNSRTSMPANSPGNTSANVFHGPLWIVAGQSLFAHCFDVGDTYLISILEFNITP